MGVSREEEGENPDDAGQADGEADFGEADAEIPQRAMPDYGDVIDEGDAKEEDDDNLGQGLKSAARPGGSKARPEAIHVAGAQRLGATHFSAILALKELPKFVRLEWVSDNEVLLVFNEVKEATAALKSLQEGFDNVPETAGGKDPGVWRARRGMLEFRQATADDLPPMGFKRQKRAGRQVHEYRLWAAEQAADMSVDEEEGVTVASQAKKLGLKNWRDWRKRATREQGGITDDEDIDLLAQMSQQDKEILAKEPGANGHAADELWFEPPARGRKRQWEASAWYGEDDDAWWGSAGRDDSWGSSRGRQGQSWWRETGWGSWNDGPRDRWDDGSGRSAKRRRGDDGDGGAGGTLATKEENPGSARQGQERRGGAMAADVDEEERSRRQKRQERFKAQAAKAEAPTSEQPQAQAEAAPEA